MAGYGKYIPDTDRSINPSGKIALDHFLLDHFVPWGKESYQSINGKNMYTHPEFVNLAKEWMNSGKIKDMSVEKMDRLQEKLSIALENGYGYTRTETEQILEPIVSAFVMAVNRMIRTGMRFVDNVFCFFYTFIGSISKRPPRGS